MRLAVAVILVNSSSLALNMASYKPRSELLACLVVLDDL